MNTIALYIISILHLSFILFVVGVPLFVDLNCVLLLHAVIVPFIMAHWFADDNMCVLTMLEKKFRTYVYGEEYAKPEDCFSCRLIEPVYDFNKNFTELQNLLYVATICLWVGTMYKLYLNYKTGKLCSFSDLFNCN